MIPERLGSSLPLSRPVTPAREAWAMNIQTDRAFVAADRPAVRYCTVTLTSSDSARPAAQPDDRRARPLARDVSLVIRDSIGAQTRCLSSCLVAPDVDGLHIELGDLFASGNGKDITLILATEISPKALGASTSILLRLDDENEVLYGAPIEMPWTAVDAEADRAQPVNHTVVIAAATLLADRARAEALGLVRVGAYGRATKILERAVGRIRAMASDLRDVQNMANRLEDAALKYERMLELSQPLQRVVA